MTARTDEGTLGYEQARDELIDVVRRLEAGGTTLEESLALWERGEELAKVCRRWLDGARARLDAALAERDEPGGQGAPGAAGATADGGGASADGGGDERGPGR
ncbi:exodeoxyribonuclease VII small subunit [Streptomyces sp. NPDC049910]|uniref:exodeoxyribonuclease VII small subunit n=1 Tax=Streptomyces sp. NPDC049910 TaxID=3155278 RepID=UPI00341E65D1